MAAVARGRCLPRAWLCRWGPDSPLSPERQPGDPRNPRLALCSRRAGQGCGRHYRAALCAELKQPLAIEEVASRPVRPHEGDRVIGVSGFNGMAEECIIDQKTLWQIPERVPLREAATLPVSYGTAVLALEHRAHTRPGETVLVTAAAGATGLAVIDVATNVLHAQVIAAAGSDEKCKLAMQKGAQSVVNYSRGSLKEAVRTLVGSAGVNVAIDTVGGDVFLEALRSLAWEGRIVVVGFAGGTIASVPANLLLLKNVSAMGLYWSRYKEQNFPVFSRTLSSALQYCQQGRIQPHIGAVFKLEEVNDAFLHVIQRKSTGKVLISLK
ncbi:quinone oxidoreductase-like protein 2 isoform X3 [Ailuropoda melanoleuca]|uniref:quinone oxidoreductase-like protein 2 isoform X3 n=1 Tax=Ailuropoda melanoleuca TaxID=9646 RepID=UPI0014946DB0|nr:quinone oxidoreductase-like protein 2 isoform X3 [Ailuropoda melanoleuca]